MDAVAIIPARLGSTRFPRKVLADSTGHPMIWHVCQRAAQARSVRRVVVATNAAEVSDAVNAFGGEVVLTGEHPNGTSRLAEAARLLNLPPQAVVVNVQGDEPELDPALIDLAVDALSTSDAPMATVAAPFAPGEDPENPNIVKALVSAQGRALYFSRSPVPYRRDPTGAGPLKHIGLYVYRRAFLERYVRLPATPLETAEALEQLRALEHGHAIAVAIGEAGHHGVDTPEQYEAFVARWRAANT